MEVILRERKIGVSNYCLIGSRVPTSVRVSVQPGGIQAVGETMRRSCAIGVNQGAHECDGATVSDLRRS